MLLTRLSSKSLQAIYKQRKSKIEENGMVLLYRFPDSLKMVIFGKAKLFKSFAEDDPGLRIDRKALSLRCSVSHTYSSDHNPKAQKLSQTHKRASLEEGPSQKALWVTSMEIILCPARRKLKRPSHGGGVVGMIRT